MRVENPDFSGAFGEVVCDECPLDVLSDSECLDWMCDHDHRCPRNTEEYTAACLMAEEAAKGGKE
jgi:hypothetical protein